MKPVVTRINIELRKDIEKFIKEHKEVIGYTITKLDFINQAVREKLKRDGIKLKNEK